MDRIITDVSGIKQKKAQSNSSRLLCGRIGDRTVPTGVDTTRSNLG